jgi:hypothetical protein
VETRKPTCALERSGRGQPSHGAKVIEDIQKPRQDLLSLVVARKFDWPHIIFYRAFSLASGFRHNTTMNEGTASGNSKVITLSKNDVLYLTDTACEEVVTLSKHDYYTEADHHDTMTTNYISHTNRE